MFCFHLPSGEDYICSNRNEVGLNLFQVGSSLTESVMCLLLGCDGQWHTTVTISKPEGNVTGIQYNDINNLLEVRNGESDRGY